MCFGPELIAIVGGLASLAGTAASTISAQKSAEAQAKARNNALQDYMDKNKALTEEAQGALQKRLAQEGGTPEEQQQPLQERRQAETGAVLDRATTSAPIQLSGNAPKVVADEAAKAQSATDSAARRRADDLAGIRSFGDLLFEKGQATAETGRDLGMVNRFASQNAAMLPIQQDLAQTRAASKGGTLGQIGSILGAAGSLASGYAGAAGGGYGATTAANTPFKGAAHSIYLPNGSIALPNLGL